MYYSKNMLHDIKNIAMSWPSRAIMIVKLKK